MRRLDTARVLWEVQDLREQLVLARAEQVKMERVIRDIVREPRNRAMVFHQGSIPYYAWPSEAVSDLREMGRLAYLVFPGRKNRIKPEVLLRRYEDKVAAVRNLAQRLAAAEAGARHAGIGTGEALPEERLAAVETMPWKPAAPDPHHPPAGEGGDPAMARHVDWLWNNAPVPPDIRRATLTRNALVRNGYVTVAALTGATEEELMDIRTFGEGCMAEVRRVLAAHGLTLAGDQEKP